ncbi:MAG: 2-oxo acid dehydrogenase subunit E2 [Rhodopila sp.]|jgi:pyruvate/2-oxoglutarate dehydrogenase complex dihydrolipoamide acyltransferase (E2) component
MLERETANDETGTVVAVFVESNTFVQKDEVLFDIENSKATQEVVAPESGLLLHDMKVGQTVNFGVPIAHINPAPAVVPGPGGTPVTTGCPPPTRDAHSDHQPPAEGKVSNPRFSHAAAALIAELGLTSAHFTTGLVTTRDIRALADAPAAQRPSTPAPATPPAPAMPTRSGGRAVSGRKRAEIETLSKGAGDTMLSVLGTSLGAMDVARGADDFLAGRITDLVIYEASRLLKKYPALNAFYADGEVHRHADIHAGLAIDRGGQLVVYGIEHADRVSLPEVAGEIADAVARYMNNELTSAEMSRATFTVTDLSADELDFVLPLLPHGQSCILGITRSEEAGYRVFAGFDHRVTEGREVASFLSELRQRLQSFASSATRPSAVIAECTFCGRSAHDAVWSSKDKGLLKLVDREGRDVLCCASCWNGW